MITSNIKNQITFIALLLFAFLLFSPVAPAWAKTETYGDYTYYRTKDDDGSPYIILTSYNGREENLVIPETIDSVEVRNVPENYKYPDQVKTITLSKNTRYASYTAFYELSHLEAIQVAEGNKYLKSVSGVLYRYDPQGVELVFYPQAKKGNSFSVPSKVTSLGEAFVGNRYLKKIIFNDTCTYVGGASESNVETVIIGNQTRVIGENGFYNCKKLKKVVLGKSVALIEDAAFYECTSLSQIHFPDSLNVIEGLAFGNCKSLKGTIQIPKNVYFIGSDAFKGSKAKIKPNEYLVKKGRNYVGKAKVFTGKKTKQYLIEDFTKIKPEKTSITLKKGAIKKVNTTIYVNGKKKGILKDRFLLNYTSSNPKVARVSSYGNVKGMKTGTAVITVTLNSLEPKTRAKIKIKIKVK